MSSEEHSFFGDIGGKLHYTPRLLRSGYLYVFDEARSRWEGYYVTPEAYLLKFDVKQPMPVGYASNPKPCNDTGHPEAAGMITIRDPKYATRVWFGFSDVEWTADVLEQHGSANYRKKHMQMVDVQTALKHAKQPNVHPLKELGAKVAEFACDSLRTNAADVLFKFNPRKPQLAQTLRVADSLHKDGGIIVSLHDPAGMAAELAHWMDERMQMFLDKPEYKRELAVSSSIVQIQGMICNQAELAEVAASEDLAADAESGMHEIYSAGWMPGQPLQPDPELAKLHRKLTADDLVRAGKTAWSGYTAKFDESARVKWQEQYDAAFLRFDQDFIAPLVKAHVAWMKSVHLREYFQGNYDTADVHSGQVYTAVFSRSIGATQDKLACKALYSEWFAGTPDDKTNLLHRALVYNQDVLAKEVQDAAASSVDWRDLPWDKLISVFDLAVGNALEGKSDVLAQLLARLAGSITEALNKAVESPKLHAGLLAISASQRTPLIRVEVTGSKKAFRAMVIREMIKLAHESGEKLPDSHTLKRAVSAELRRLEILGLDMAGSDKKKFFAVIDPEKVRTLFGRGASHQQVAQGVAKAIRTPEQLEALELGRWRQRIKTASTNVTSAMKGGTPFGFGLLTAFVQYHALSSLISQDAKAMSHQKTEIARRLLSQGAQLVGTFGELIGRGMSRLYSIGFKFGRSLIYAAGEGIKVWGRRLGIAGALVMAGLDIAKAFSEYDEGNAQAGWAYMISGVLGIAATIFCLYIPLVGLVLVGLMILWSFAMTRMVDNKLQDWLERAYRWGKLENQRYPTSEQEMAELNIALGR